jgi:MATE family multidrug resistance protein
MMITSVADLTDGEVAAIATTTPTVFVPGVVVSMPKNLEQNLPQRSVATRGNLSSLDDSAAVENVLNWWTEVCEQCWLSGPTILMLLLQYLTALTVVTFVGRLGASYLAAMSMATSFVGIVGFDVLTGLSSGLETLCGQAYGAKQYHLLGIYLQRAIFVLLVVAIPICLASYYMAPILIAFGENPAIANNAQLYGRYLLPCILAFTVMMPLVKFCQSQRIVVPLMWCAAAACLLQVPLCLLLITKLNWGYKGGAVAMSVSTILDTVILVTILRFSPKCKKSFTSLSLEALHDLRGFFKLAVPSALMMW